MGPIWSYCPKKEHPPYISNSQGCPKCREEADRGISVGSAIGDSIITGDGNVVVVRYHDVEVKPIEQVEEPIRRGAISQDQAFERIGAAVRLNLSQLERNIEQARKESNQFFKLTLIFASIGFLVVVAGIAFLLAGQVAAGIVAAVSSTVPEVTATLFFKKDKELRKTSSYIISICWNHNESLRWLMLLPQLRMR